MRGCAHLAFVQAVVFKLKIINFILMTVIAQCYKHCKHLAVVLVKRGHVLQLLKMQELFQKECSFLWAFPGLFLFILRHLQQIHVKTFSFSIRCWDLNPQPSERESPLITTRPGLPPIQIIVLTKRFYSCNRYKKIIVYSKQAPKSVLHKKEDENKFQNLV